MKIARTFPLPRAARILGVSPAMLERLVARERVVPRRERGVPRFTFADLAQLRGTVERTSPTTPPVSGVPIDLTLRIAARASAEAHAAAGDVFWKAGRAEDAVTAFRRAIAADPRFPAPYVGLGRAAVNKGRLAEAVVFLRRALVLAPGDASPVALLAMAYLKRGLAQKAIPLYREALALDPKNVDVRYFRRYSTMMGVELPVPRPSRRLPPVSR